MSIRFNGSSSNFLSRTTSLPDYNSAYTIMAWVKLKVDTNDFATMFNLAVGASLNFDLTQCGSDGTVLVTAARISGSGANGNGSTLTVDQWVHVTMRRASATDLSMFLNASLDGGPVTTNVTGRTAQDVMEIGRTHVNGFTGEALNAEMAYLRIWATNLSDAQIAAEKESTSAVNTTSLYGDYPMAAGSSAGDDTSGQSHPFTINGTISDGASEPPVGLPTAHAGFDQTRMEFETVMLDSSQSTDAVGITARLWEQVSGTAVTLINPTSVNPTFVAPDVASPTNLVFKVTVEDVDNNTAEDQVTITIVPTGSTTWLWHAPQEEGIDPDVLYNTINSLVSPAMIIRNGRVLASKGDITQEGYIWSGSKSLVALIFARQLKLGNVNDADTVPSSDNPSSPLATFAQMMSMTSDFGLSPHSPGSFYAYNNAAVHHYGTYLKTTFYPGDDHVQTLQNAFVGVLDFEDTLTYNASGFMSGWDGGWNMSCRDLARICQLILQRGAWEGSQIIDADFVDRLYINQVPNGASQNPDTDDQFYNETQGVNPTNELPFAYSFGFWLTQKTDIMSTASVNEAIAMVGAFGTSAYISRQKGLIVLACNVGGTTTNTQALSITGSQFDQIADATPNAITGPSLFRGRGFLFFDDDQVNRFEFWPAITSTVDLVIQNASHGHVADNLTLTQVHQLAVQNASHSHTAQNLALTQVHSLSVQNASHSHTAGNLVLTQVHNLALQNASHSHTADNLTLTQVHTLVVQDGSHTHSAENIALTQAHALVVQSATHAHSAENVAITSSTALVIQNGTHSHSADSLTLTQVHGLTIQNAAHSHTAANIDLTQAHSLVVQSGDHAHAAQSITLIQVHNLTVADTSHAQTAENVVLVVQGDLGIQNATHGHTAENLTLTQVHGLAVQDSSHSHTAQNVSLVVDLAIQAAQHGHFAENVTLTQTHALNIQNASHAHVAENAVLTQTHVLTVQDTTHGHTAGSLVLGQVHFLGISGAQHPHTAENLALTQTQNLIIANSFHAHTAENIRFGKKIRTLVTINRATLNRDTVLTAASQKSSLLRAEEKGGDGRSND